MLTGLITLTMIAYYADGRLSVPAFLALILVMLILLISPALVERTLKHSG
jgi:hypothetical protein